MRHIMVRQAVRTMQCCWHAHYQPLTRPQSKDKKQGLSSTIVANRVRQHLADAKLYRGQTVHGSMRGSMQHAVHVLGHSSEDVAKAAQIRTPAIIQQYLDHFRHCG